MNSLLWAVAVACLVALLLVRLIWERRQRSLFVDRLSRQRRLLLRAFERVKGDWHEYRELKDRQQTELRNVRQRMEHHPES